MNRRLFMNEVQLTPGRRSKLIKVRKCKSEAPGRMTMSDPKNTEDRMANFLETHRETPLQCLAVQLLVGKGFRRIMYDDRVPLTR